MLETRRSLEVETDRCMITREAEEGVWPKGLPLTLGKVILIEFR